MLKKLLSLAIAVLVWLTSVPVVNAVEIPSNSLAMNAVSSQKTDEAIIRERIEEWRSLWSQGDRKFSYAGYEHLFLNSDQYLLYDTVSPGHTRMQGWQQTVDLWEPYMQTHLTNWKITRLENVQVSVSGDMAWSAFELYGEGKFDGEPVQDSQQGTQVWRKLEGQWRIVHEHWSGPVH